MSADDDRLTYSGDPKHAKDPLAYGGLDALFGGPVAALPRGRSRHSDTPASAPPLVLTSTFAAPGEAEITAKLPVVANRSNRRPSNGSISSVGNWILEQPVPTVVASEPRAIDNLARVGVRSAVKMQPRRGWRRAVFVATRINLGLSRDELYELDLYARVRRTARESHQIAVFGLKGGVGKTAVTVALGSVLSAVRGDRILAVDADPASGNLADRVGRQSAATVSDLLAAKDLSRYNDVRAYTSMNEAKLEVLSSAEYSGAGRAFNDADWKAATAAVSKHYNLILADGAADMFTSAARGVLSTVSGAVIVASASIDGARQAAVTLDWLRHNGYQELLNRSCVVVNHVGPRKPNVNIGDLVHQFQKHVAPGRVFVLPWDKHIAAGTEIHLDLLRPRFRRRILELAAALSDDFEGGSGLA
ncbi:MinD-like ATPase involved in chromosome partitioning or flagellar assembly [Mycobacterium frederiksbergense]|uniref:MinD-like ATPase involved in chromosome partitioning or flagellar assembly n=1 Tax=Mycolicibacterium frederiksbergense TaxID=117567 RepID=A0ABT6L592_9MYCO|nr:MinD/ParA family protein [Mycolicibacterium frederiksbergense]MDH6197357.1 MinD-like ATPase involved in chromosome partitioning or flagellar assembly [Mycolicibacterium frederiksbergense]